MRWSLRLPLCSCVSCGKEAVLSEFLLRVSLEQLLWNMARTCSGFPPGALCACDQCSATLPTVGSQVCTLAFPGVCSRTALTHLRLLDTLPQSILAGVSIFSLVVLGLSP